MRRLFRNAIHFFLPRRPRRLLFAPDGVMPLVGRGRVTQQVLGQGLVIQGLAGRGRVTQLIAGVGRITQQIAGRVIVIQGIQDDS